MKRSRMAAAALVAALLAVLAPVVAGAQQPARGEAQLLALIPSPGYPASAYPHPNGKVYVGTYINPNGSSQRSRVLEYTADGQLQRSWTVPGQDLSADHGIQAATSDADGNLVLLDRTPARALKLDTRTGDFTEYATFANLPTCAPGGTSTEAQPCSPALADGEPMANYAAWGPDGSLYVTDYLQAVVWRVPPGGGAAQVWLADRRLDGFEFGTTGIALAPDQKTLLIAQGSSATSLAPTSPATGKLYSVPIGADGKPGEMKQLWESGPAELPDGFGIGRSGRIYMTVLAANAIVVLEPDGREIERFTSPLFDSPSSSKILGTKAVVPNQSYIAGDPAKQSLVAVELGEEGHPELIPGESSRGEPDELKPRLTRIGARSRTASTVKVVFRSSEAATVTAALQRRVRGRWRTVRDALVEAKAGSNSTRLSLRGQKGRTLRVLLTAKDAAGNTSSRASRTFRVR